jgi:hypothetical protein
LTAASFGGGAGERHVRVDNESAAQEEFYRRAELHQTEEMGSLAR